MSDVNLREIIGLAEKSKWNQVKKFIKFVIQKTLRKNTEYRLTALNISINGKKQPKYNSIIKNRENIKTIDKINDFNHLSLYQSTQNSNNLIDISKNDGTIIVLAKYMGPSLNDHQIFDFSVHMDVIENPFFTNGTGKKLSCSEFLKTINHTEKPEIKTYQKKKKDEPKQLKKEKISKDLEIFVFEKLTNKHAIWNEKETKAFKNWKAKHVNKYRLETGKITYYKGKPTNKFSEYLKSILKNKTKKKKRTSIKPKSKKSIPKKKDHDFSETFVFESLTGKNAKWNGKETKNFQKWKVKIANKYRKESKKPAYYKGKPTNKFSNYLKRLLENKIYKRKKPPIKPKSNKNIPKKVVQEFSEAIVFESLTGKNVKWNGKETKNFQKWKVKVANKYRKESKKPAYYKGKPTNKFSEYLRSLLKNKTKKKKKKTPIKPKSKKSISKKKDQDVSEAFLFESLTGKNAKLNGKETKNFQKWKRKIAKQYQKETGKNTYYRGKLTKSFKSYLGKLVKKKTN